MITKQVMLCTPIFVDIGNSVCVIVSCEQTGEPSRDPYVRLIDRVSI